jgi:hypothetical protein
MGVHRLRLAKPRRTARFRHSEIEFLYVLDPNPEGGAQVRLGIDRFHRSEEEYARSTGARFRSSSDAGELQHQGGSCDTWKFRLA